MRVLECTFMELISNTITHIEMQYCAQKLLHEHFEIHRWLDICISLKACAGCSYTILYIIVETCFLLYQDEAQLKYVELIDSLVSAEENTTSSSEPGQYTTLKVTNENGLYKIQLNRPSKKNAITIDVGALIYD